MNFLDLCKRLSQEAGYSGAGPSKVTDQTGEMKRVVDWTREAWIDIQNLHPHWRFMLKPFSMTMSDGESAVTVANDFSTAKPDSVVVTRANGGKVWPRELRPEEMRQLLRERTDVPSYPHYYSIDDTGLMTVFPSCNQDVTIAGDYYRTPVTLAENTDVPHIREEHHMLIVWHGLISSGAYEESSNAYNFAHEKWETALNNLQQKEMPRFVAGGPVA